jgi:uncharacterized protein
MRVLVIGDTHWTDDKVRLSETAREMLPLADAVIHVGDIVTHLALERLRAMVPVLNAVNGNYREIGHDLPDWLIGNLAGVKIGVVHGQDSGATIRVGQRPAFHERLLAGFKHRPQIVVYGHTHFPLCERGESGVWFINPGSQFRNAFGGTSCALLKMQPPETITVHIYRDRATGGTGR